jgi:hypothetical protein
MGERAVSLEYIAKTYNVPATRGRRITFHDTDDRKREGVIIGSRDQYLRVHFAEDNKVRHLHPTWRVTYGALVEVPPLNPTPLRLSILRFLADRDWYSMNALVHELVPRHASGSGRRITWTEQGAARMSGALLAPMRTHDWIEVDIRRRLARITDAGRDILAKRGQQGAEQ